MIVFPEKPEIKNTGPRYSLLSIARIDRIDPDPGMSGERTRLISRYLIGNTVIRIIEVREIRNSSPSLHPRGYYVLKNNKYDTSTNYLNSHHGHIYRFNLPARLDTMEEVHGALRRDFSKILNIKIHNPRLCHLSPEKKYKY
jgi:hypothetical protein